MRVVGSRRAALVSALVVALAAVAGVLWLRSEPSAIGAPRSVILVVVDTLRADHLGLYGYQRPTSPALDAAAAEGVVFERAFATSPWTLPSFGSIFTGLLPSRHGAVSLLGAIAEDTPTLAEILAARGYATAALVCNPLLEPRYGMARGFAEYDAYPCTNEHIRRADAAVDAALTWIDGRQGPFFLLLHLFDPHMTYDPPAEVRGRFTGAYDVEMKLPFRRMNRALRFGESRLSAAEQGFVAAAYDEEVLFVDQQIGRFIAALRERGVWRETLVVLTSDHGEELFDHGGFEHGHTLYQEQLHVPFVVWGPGVRGGRSQTPVSLTDVVPTVLDAVGLAAGHGGDGVSLWPHLTRREPVAPRPLLAEVPLYGTPGVAVVRWPFKAILDLPDYRGRLFDLSADAGETVDRSGAAPAVVDELREIARASSTAPGAPAVARPTLDPSTRERLRALGYVE